MPLCFFRWFGTASVPALASSYLDAGLDASRANAPAWASAYDPATDIPGDALDRGDYASFALWCADCISQDKAGKIDTSETLASGDYYIRPPKAIYGYGYTGTSYPTVTGDGVKGLFYQDTTAFECYGVHFKDIRSVFAGVTDVNTYGADNGKPWGYSSFNSGHMGVLQSSGSSWHAGSALVTSHSSYTTGNAAITMGFCKFTDCDLSITWFGHKARCGNVTAFDCIYEGTYSAFSCESPWLPAITRLYNLEFKVSAARTTMPTYKLRAGNTCINIGNEIVNTGTYATSRGSDYSMGGDGFTQAEVFNTNSHIIDISFCHASGWTSTNNNSSHNAGCFLDIRGARGASADDIKARFNKVVGIKGTVGQEDGQCIYTKVYNALFEHNWVEDCGAADASGSGGGNGTEASAFLHKTAGQYHGGVRLVGNYIKNPPDNIPVIRFDDADPATVMEIDSNIIDGQTYTAHNPSSDNSRMGVIRTYNNTGQLSITDNILRNMVYTTVTDMPKLINLHSQVTSGSNSTTITGNLLEDSPGANVAVIRAPGGVDTLSSNKTTDNYDWTVAV